MRHPISFLAVLLPVLVLLDLGFLSIMRKFEQAWVLSDLNHRGNLLTDSVRDWVIHSLERSEPKRLTPVLNRLTRDSRLVGALFCSPDGALVSKSNDVPAAIGCDGVAQLAVSDPGFLTVGDLTLHRGAYPLKDDMGDLKGYLIYVHDPSYMERRGQVTQKLALVLFLALGCTAAFLATLSDTVKGIIANLGAPRRRMPAPALPTTPRLCDRCGKLADREDEQAARNRAAV